MNDKARFRVEYLAEGIETNQYTESKLEAQTIATALLEQGYEPVIYEV